MLSVLYSRDCERELRLPVPIRATLSPRIPTLANGHEWTAGGQPRLGNFVLYESLVRCAWRSIHKSTSQGTQCSAKTLLTVSVNSVMSEEASLR